MNWNRIGKIEQAYRLCLGKCQEMEYTLNMEYTNLETIYEGKFIFRYEVYFSDNENNKKPFIVEVNSRVKTAKYKKKYKLLKTKKGL